MIGHNWVHGSLPYFLAYKLRTIILTGPSMATSSMIISGGLSLIRKCCLLGMKIQTNELPAQVVNMNVTCGRALRVALAYDS